MKVGSPYVNEEVGEGRTIPSGMTLVKLKGIRYYQSQLWIIDQV